MDLTINVSKFSCMQRILVIALKYIFCNIVGIYGQEINWLNNSISYLE